MKGSQFSQLNDVAWLTEHYVEQELNAIEIAKIVGCERNSVIRALKRNGIEIRSYGNRKTRFPQLEDREWLAAEMETKSLRQIGKELGTTAAAVQYFAKKYGFIRSQARSDAVKDALAKRYPNGRWGADSSNWRGGRRKTRAGYILVYAPDHPRASGERSAVFEHIVVMEQALGRSLEQDEIVHHVNHVKDDNRPENLIVKKKGAHIREHFEAGTGFDALKAENARLRALLEANDIDPDD